MAVIKKSKSGKSLQFITDEGLVYQLSAKLFGMVVNNQISGDFVVLTRMPIPNLNSFPPSPVYGDGGVSSAVARAGANAGSRDFLVERENQKLGRKASEFKVEW